MGKARPDGLDEELTAFIEAQPIFFVATAPREGGHVNVSPKGYDTLRVLGPWRVAYRDLTGSGAETAAHLRDDGRITLMWMALAGRPRIVRVQGLGRYVVDGDADFTTLHEQLPHLPGARGIVVVEADRVASSCGYSVPLMRIDAERDTLQRWAEAKGDEALDAYQRERNATSIDGLPALP